MSYQFIALSIWVRPWTSVYDYQDHLLKALHARNEVLMRTITKRHIHSLPGYCNIMLDILLYCIVLYCIVFCFIVLRCVKSWTYMHIVPIQINIDLLYLLWMLHVFILWFSWVFLGQYEFCKNCGTNGCLCRTQSWLLATTENARTPIKTWGIWTKSKARRGLYIRAKCQHSITEASCKSWTYADIYNALSIHPD